MSSEREKEKETDDVEWVVISNGASSWHLFRIRYSVRIPDIMTVLSLRQWSERRPLMKKNAFPFLERRRVSLESSQDSTCILFFGENDITCFRLTLEYYYSLLSFFRDSCILQNFLYFVWNFFLLHTKYKSNPFCTKVSSLHFFYFWKEFLLQCRLFLFPISDSISLYPNLSFYFFGCSKSHLHNRRNFSEIHNQVNMNPCVSSSEVWNVI
jgi:hypothetical protein